jgi:hypothetical protein
LKFVKYNLANKWSYIRNIKSNLQLCDFRDIKYVSDVCTKLIINKKDCHFSFLSPKIYNIDIVNHNIKHLHIDLGMRDKHYYILNSIEANNLLEIVLCYVKYMNIDLINNLSKTCPSLKKLKIIFCKNIDSDYVSDIFKDCKIDLYIKNNNY